jgi:hypothetical protein
MKSTLCYVAGPYRGDVERNIETARQVAIQLWQAGFPTICPHLNTARFEIDCLIPDQDYLDGDLVMLARCDALVMAPDWERSQGARQEFIFATQNDIPVYVWPQMPPGEKP